MKSPSALLLFTILLLLTSSEISMAQSTRHIVELTDKKATLHQLDRPQDFLSTRALDRRRRQRIAIDSTDLPPCPAYLDSIRTIRNLTVLNASRWLNQVAVQTSDPQALKRLRSLPFVKKVYTVGYRPIDTDREVDDLEETFTTASASSSSHLATSLNYGRNLAQVHLHEGEFLHDLGYRGQGILIAMLDGGYRNYLSNPAFDSLRRAGHVQGTWDFVAMDGSVDEDDAHGANCLSIIASNMPGQMIGTAPMASFLLYRTEEVASEYLVEEHFWAVGAERADSLGADLISSSLGYINFDDRSMDHRYTDMDGNTTMVTRAADMAAGKGMIVCNSAGNSGSSAWKFIGAPADGDSVVAIGAVDAAGKVANFSSFGPTSDGRIKPDLASVGAGTFTVLPSGTVAQGNGTSYSTPNLAGLIACLWQAFPAFTNMEIIDAVRRSADRFDSPNDRTGYGIPNMRLAYGRLLDIRAYRQAEGILRQDRIRVYPVPFTDRLHIIYRPERDGLLLFELTDAIGQRLRAVEQAGRAGVILSVDLPDLESLPAGVYQLRYIGDGTTGVVRIMK